MKALIINDRPWHHECYIHIIDFCLSKNVQVDILEFFKDDYSLRDFYNSLFNKKINYKKGFGIEKDGSFGKEYSLIFLVTDNIDLPFNSIYKHKNSTEKNNIPVKHLHSLLNNPNIYDKMNSKIVSINHTDEQRNHFTNHVSIRPFSNQRVPYAYSFAEVITSEQKKDILKSENHTNILLCAGDHNFSAETEIPKILKLNDNIKLYWCHRNVNEKKFSHIKNLTIVKDAPQAHINDLLKKCHYVYIPKYKNKDYKTESSSSIVNQAFSFCCQIIWPERNYNKNYKLYSPLEYSDGLKIEPNPDIQLVAKERREQIDHRNKVFSSFLKKDRVKIHASVLNHNQPELTDNVFNLMSCNNKKCSLEIDVLDNGSTINQLPQNCTIKIKDTIFFGGGYSLLLDKFLKSKNDYFAVLNNDIFFHGSYFFDRIIEEMENFDLSLFSPSLINSSVNQCTWKQMWNWHTNSVRLVDFVDFVFPVMRRDLAEKILKFPEELKLGWGYDFYSGIIARLNNLKVGVSDNISITHLVSYTFRSGSSEVSENQFSTKAFKNMSSYFNNSKYNIHFEQMKANNMHYKL